MRLTLHTDYALRVLVHVGLEEGRLVTISEIAERFAISKNHLTKVVHQLGKAGYLTTVRGKFGGIRLRLPPDAVRLGALIRDTEEGFGLVPCERGECGEGDGEACKIQSHCVGRKALAEAVDVFFASLDRYTLADLLAVESGAHPEVYGA